MGMQYTKDMQLYSKRIKKTTKQRGNISRNVRYKVQVRANGHCEWCGVSEAAIWGLQCAHLVRRWKVDETTETEVVMLCGPSVNSGTCHWKVDYTAAGREWAKQFRLKLLEESI